MSDPGKTYGIRWTAKRKAEVVLVLLKGGDTTELCRKHGITKSELYNWRDSFIEAGIKNLKFKRDRKSSRDKEVSRLERKVGRLTMKLEILEDVARLKKTKQLD